MDKLVTIIIPAYNAAATLDHTLQSVIGQSDKLYNCIIVDDGSTDATAEIAAKYCQKMSNFQLLQHDTNRSLSSALRTGFSAVTTPYAAMLDADDLLEPNAIQEANRLIRLEHPEVIEFAYYSDKVLRSKKLYSHFSNTSYRMTTPDEIHCLKEHIKAVECIFLRWNKVLRMDIVKQILPHYPEGLNYSEDSWFCFLSYYYASQICYSHYAAYNYLNYPNSMSHQGTTIAAQQSVERILREVELMGLQHEKIYEYFMYKWKRTKQLIEP